MINVKQHSMSSSPSGALLWLRHPADTQRIDCSGGPEVQGATHLTGECRGQNRVRLPSPFPSPLTPPHLSKFPLGPTSSQALSYLLQKPVLASIACDGWERPSSSGAQTPENHLSTDASPISQQQMYFCLPPLSYVSVDPETSREEGISFRASLPQQQARTQLRCGLELSLQGHY